MRKLLTINSKLLASKGFTFMELIIVIALIGLLVSVSITVINPVTYLQKSRDSQRKSDLRQMQAALELYRSDNGFYPVLSTLQSCGSAWTGGGVTYMQKVPCDPSSGQAYSYNPQPVNCNNIGANLCNTYYVYACLQNTSDSERDTTDICPAPDTVSFTVWNP